MKSFKEREQVKFKKSAVKWHLDHFDELNLSHKDKGYDKEALIEYAFWKGLAAGMKTKVVVLNGVQQGDKDDPSIVVVARNACGHLTGSYGVKELRKL